MIINSKKDERSPFELSEEELHEINELSEREDEGEPDYISWEEVVENLIAKHNLKLRNDE